MTALPIVERELRVASRRKPTYYLRVSFASAALLVAGWKALSLVGFSQAVQGRTVYVWLFSLAFFYCLFLGVWLTADSLSEEKREGTLGLLFLTDLQGYDVVLGKLAARSLGAAYSLISILPILAVSFILGGVTLKEYGQAALLLGNTMFFSLATGLLLSAACRHERKAMVGAFFVIFLATVVPIVAAAFLAVYFGLGPFDDALYWTGFVFSPAYAYLYLSVRAPIPMAIPASSFWGSLILVHLLAWAFLALASSIIRRTWQDQPESREAAGKRSLWNRLAFGTAASRASVRRRFLELNPVTWLHVRQRFKPVLVWFFLACMGALWVWDWSQLGSFMWEADNALMMAALLHLFLKAWIAIEASARFVDDRKAGAMELLLTSPLREQDYVRGHLLALRRQFALPILAVLAFDLILWWNVKPATGLWRFAWLQSMPPVQALFLSSIVLFLVESLALVWVGIWLGLFAKNINRALAGALGRVVVAPWAVVGAAWVGLAILEVVVSSFGLRLFPFGRETDGIMVAIIITRLLVAVVMCACFAWAAMNSVMLHMRLVCAEGRPPRGESLLHKRRAQMGGQFIRPTAVVR